MSKLEEVIEMLNHVLINESWGISDNQSGVNDLAVVETYDLKPVLDALRKMNRPVKYTVTLTKSGETSSLNGEEYISAQINGVNLFYGVNQEVIRKAAIHQIQIHAKAMGIPPITMEQITFVEV